MDNDTFGPTMDLGLEWGSGDADREGLVVQVYVPSVVP